MVVKQGGSHSRSYYPKLGIPQGSVFGPLLCLLFINELPQHIVACIIILFADDTFLAIKARNLEELIRICKSLIEQFIVWCRRNSLIVNLDKAKIIKFQIRDGLDFTVELSDFSLRSTECVSFLGVRVDSKLRWSFHIDHVCNKISKSYFAISRLKSSLSLDSLVGWFSSVYSHLCYNVVLWGSFPDVFVAQKRILDESS